MKFIPFFLVSLLLTPCTPVFAKQVQPANAKMSQRETTVMPQCSINKGKIASENQWSIQKIGNVSLAYLLVSESTGIYHHAEPKVKCVIIENRVITGYFYMYPKDGNAIFLEGDALTDEEQKTLRSTGLIE